MTPLTFQTLRLLADGEFRSGEAMARLLGVSRASVWNALHALDNSGLDLFKVRGRGYRLAQPLSLLDAGEVGRQLGTQAPCFKLQLMESAESTSTLLMRLADDGGAHGTVVAAELQTAGRGRRGRIWYSTLGGALTFSLLWRFQQGAGLLSGLSLVAGIAVMRALAAAGVDGAGLKWPNDVLWRGRKLAGILVEVHGDVLGPSAAVIGIGINCRLSPQLRKQIDQPAADIADACGAAPDRNRLLANTLLELGRLLTDFAHTGFPPLRAEWQRYHVHQDKPVTLLLPDGRSESGVALGVADSGALLLATGAGQLQFHSGEVSLRGHHAPRRAPADARGAT